MANGDHFKSLSDIPDHKWEILNTRKIFFGHQSVGNNIVNGIENILKTNPIIKLPVVETTKQDDFNTPVFAHAKVGENFYPISKNDDFTAILNGGIGEKVDIAFYKYCYVDIREDADVNAIFTSYRGNMKILRNRYPRVAFVHVTVPLVVVQTGPRAWVKKIIGRKIGGYDDNIKRNEFNILLKNEYGGREPVFDLARIESSFPNGSTMTFKKDGKIYNALVPDYASDGRHLNEKGSRFVAEQLLIFLAELSG